MARGNNKSSNQRNNNGNKNSNGGKSRHSYRGKQGRKDSTSKRVNFDNAREDKVKEAIEEAKSAVSGNDISWYARNPEFLKSAGSIPFASILGQIDSDTGMAVPGVMVLPWAPSFALGDNATVLKQAFTSTYSFVVHANSRNTKYDDVDLGLTTMAGMEVFEILQCMTRAYGVVKWYREQNFYLPDTVIKALGFIPDDLRSNLGQLWFQLNQLIDQTRSIWVPDAFPIFDRHLWMNTRIFADADGPRAQIYFYNRTGFYGFAETLSKTGTALALMTVNAGFYNPANSENAGDKPFDPCNDQYTVAQWVQLAQKMISLLLNSQDRGIMYGDILNAYKAERIRAMQPIDSNFVIAPEYNPEVMMQIENYHPVNHQFRPIIFGQNEAEFTVDIERLTAKTVGFDGDWKTSIYNFHLVDQPTPENIMIATRMSAGGLMRKNFDAFDYETGEWNSVFYPLPTCFGSELPFEPIIWTKIKSIAQYPSSDQSIVAPLFYYATNSPSIPPQTVPAYVAIMESFDWHPFWLYVRGNNPMWSTADANWSSQTIDVYPLFAVGDHDNYSFLSWNDINKLHRVAIYSLWGVPQI